MSKKTDAENYVEVETVHAKIGDEFWYDRLKRWIPIEVRAQQLGVRNGSYLVRRKIAKAGISIQAGNKIKITGSGKADGEWTAVSASEGNVTLERRAPKRK